MQRDEVLVRLASDAGFREHVQRDPAAALAGYRLSAEDLAAVQAWLARQSGRPVAPGVANLLAGDDPDAAEPAAATVADLFGRMLADADVAGRVRQDPDAVAAEWGLPLAEVRRLGSLSVADSVADAEPLLLDQRLSKSALFFGGGHGASLHPHADAASHPAAAGHDDFGVVKCNAHATPPLFVCDGHAAHAQPVGGGHEHAGVVRCNGHSLLPPTAHAQPAAAAHVDAGVVRCNGLPTHSSPATDGHDEFGVVKCNAHPDAPLFVCNGHAQADAPLLVCNGHAQADAPLFVCNGQAQTDAPLFVCNEHAQTAPLLVCDGHAQPAAVGGHDEFGVVKCNAHAGASPLFVCNGHAQPAVAGHQDPALLLCDGHPQAVVPHADVPGAQTSLLTGRVVEPKPEP
jgi:hypothetical protein